MSTSAKRATTLSLARVVATMQVVLAARRAARLAAYGTDSPSARSTADD